MLDMKIAGEFLGSSARERVEKCRELAAAADALADDAINPQTRKAYLDLKRQWLQVADEIAAHEISKPLEG